MEEEVVGVVELVVTLAAVEEVEAAAAPVAMFTELTGCAVAPKIKGGDMNVGVVAVVVVVVGIPAATGVVVVVVGAVVGMPIGIDVGVVTGLGMAGTMGVNVGIELVSPAPVVDFRL